MLTDERIQELANKKGVKKIAVLNFLGSIGANDNAIYAAMNLDMDSRLYKWNVATVNAIKIGIKEYFSK